MFEAALARDLESKDNESKDYESTDPEKELVSAG
jgi:hypothetical protein